MRKLLFVLVILMSASAISFAQQPAAPAAPAEKPAVQAVPPAMPAAAEVKDMALTGKVDSVILADAAKGIRPGIVVVDEKGVKVSFRVGSKTTLFDVTGKAVLLEQITKDQMVMVSYKVKDGVNRAVSITEMK
jgi:hypothetical protein